MNTIYKLLLFVICIFLTSCETSFIENPEEEKYRDEINTSLAGQFQYVWTGINNSYVFWDADPTDWDKVYKDFYPKFAALDLKGLQGGQVTNDEIEELIQELSSGFIDHHMVIKMTNPYNNHRMVFHNVGESELEKRPDYTESYIYNRIEKNIEQYYTYSIIQKASCYYKNSVHEILYATLNGDVAYLKINTCFLSEIDGFSASYKDVVNLFKSEITQKSQNKELKGIVLDFRNNGGGLETDINFWLQLFIEEPIVAYYSRGKSGLGKYDMQPWIPRETTPDAGKKLQVGNIPIVTLVNEFSGSGGEICPSVLNLLPNTHSIGIKTMGAQGALLINDFCSYYSGSFNFHNNIVNNNEAAAVRTATVATRIYNKKTGEFECLEGIGITPDEYVKIDADRLLSINGDNQLDAALSYIYRKK